MTPTTQPLHTPHHDAVSRLPPVIDTNCVGTTLSVQFASPPTVQQQQRLHSLLTADWLAQRPLLRAEVHNLVLPHVTGLRGVSAMQALDAVDAISLAVVDRMHASGAPVEAAGFDLVAHLTRQAAFSERTFGPGQRLAGVIDHITKELVEVRDSGGSLAEWVDVIILALDGAWRSGATPQAVVDAIVAKQAKNEARTWPDWRTAPADQAIEHDRSGEAPAAALDPALAQLDGIDLADAIPTRRDLLDRPTLGPNFPRASVARAQDAAAAPGADGWPRLQRPVQVGNTSFGVGVSARMVIQRAEREHEYRRRPEMERVRIQQGAEALRALRTAIGLQPAAAAAGDADGSDEAVGRWVALVRQLVPLATHHCHAVCDGNADECDKKCPIRIARGMLDEVLGHNPPPVPIHLVRQAAAEVGYAVGVHGSQVRDHDLIAAPWQAAAVGNADLIEHLCKRLAELLGKGVCMLPHSLERKPLGRWACMIVVDGWFKPIDLSIAPGPAGPAVAPATADELAAAAERLIQDARAAGHVLTIGLQPLQPLAMGHHRAVVDLRPAKG